jgi:hypothetical protein
MYTCITAVTIPLQGKAQDGFVPPALFALDRVLALVVQFDMLFHPFEGSKHESRANTRHFFLILYVAGVLLPLDRMLASMAYFYVCRSFVAFAPFNLIVCEGHESLAWRQYRAKARISPEAGKLRTGETRIVITARIS